MVKVNKKIQKNEKFDLKRYLFLIIGLFLISLSFNAFLLPNNIVFGGVSGLSMITKKYLGLDPSLFILFSSIILLVLSFVFLGFEKTKYSIFGSLMFPLFVRLTFGISNFLNVNCNDLVVCSLFGGILYGFGAGLVFRAGFTTGGTDILNQILSKYLKISMGTSLILSDGLVVLLGAFAFGLESFMYGILALYMISILTDKVLLGISNSKAFYIISSCDDEIKKYIIEQLGHGVTIFNGRGGFSKEKQNVLFCVVPTSQYFKLKEGISKIDEDAFFVATDAYEVLGGE